MSYILDALRKSEQERKTGAVAAPRPLDAAHEADTRVSRRAPAGLALFVAAILALAGLFAWRDDAPTTPSPAGAPSPAPTHFAQQDLERALPVAPAPVQISGRPPTIAPPKPGGEVRYLKEMSEAFQQQLPDLRIDIHVFTPGGAEILYINGREYRPGEFIKDGLRVEAIVQEGAVLSYAGEPFKLPRPNR